MLRGTPSHIEITLQRDDSTFEIDERPLSRHPYIFRANYLGTEDEENELSLQLLTTLDDDRYVSLSYNIGDDVEIGRYFGNPKAFVRFERILQRVLIESDGKNFSLVVLLPDLTPQRDFELSGIRCKRVSDAAYRARPLFLFTQAKPRTRASSKGHYPEE